MVTITVQMPVKNEDGKMAFSRAIIATGILLGVLVSGFLLLKYIGGTQYRRYDRLELGISFTKVEETMGEADFTCFFNNKKIMYYCDPINPFAHNPPEDIKNYSHICKIGDIPDIYGAIQIMIGKSGKVEAYTWNGEALMIYTIHGNVNDATFKKLDKKYFE